MHIESGYIQIGQRKILAQITVLDEQLFLVITDRGMEMNNLYVAMQTKYEQLPTVVTVQDYSGREDENQIQTLARSICKKNNKHLIFSYNVEVQVEPEFYLEVNKQLTQILKRVLQDLKEKEEYQQLLEMKQQQEKLDNEKEVETEKLEEKLQEQVQIKE